MARDETGSRPPRERVWRIVPLAAAVLFAVLAMDAARIETPTIDEFAHVPSGFAILAHGDTTLYAKNPPLGKALLALPGTIGGNVRVPEVREPPFGWGPWRYGDRFMRANTGRYFEVFATARDVVVALALLAALLVHGWTRTLFGERAAAVTTTLFLLCPTVLAHGHLATLDVACATTIFGAVVALRWALAAEAPAWLGPSGARFLAAGAVWGVALLVKFTAVLLLPVYAVVVFARRGRRLRRAAAEIAILCTTALVVVNLGMGFRGSFTPLGDYTFGSDFAKGIQSWLPAATPVPLPRDWMRGFDAQKRDVERAEFPSYLRGRWAREGWTGYELRALLVKTPLAFLAMLAVLPLFLWRRGPPRDELWLLLAPIAGLSLMLTAFNALNVGIRYLLPLFPFTFVLLGALFSRPGRATRTAAAVLIALYATTAIRTHPSHLAYFNAAAGGSQAGHEWLLDSNLDWGQDLYRLKPALERRGVTGRISLLYFGHVDPGLYGIDFAIPPRTPQPGLVAASVAYVKGFAYPAPRPDGRQARVRADPLAWLRDQEPVERLGSIWLYDVRADDLPPR